MSLKIWLPLNGDLENKGASAITITNKGATINNSGKIGQCYCPATINLTNLNELSFDNSSYCFWAKTSSTNSWQLIIGIDNTSNSQIHGIYVADSACLKLEYNPSLNISNSAIASWHHYAFIVKNGKSQCYYDGVLKKTSTEAVTNDVIGRLRLGVGTAVALNDVRIYDHCLSAAEVKEISQGLVLHYKLDGGTYSQSNLLPCGNTYTSSSPLVRTSKATDGAAWVSNSAFEATPSTTYTISVECDGTLSNAHGRGNLAITDKPWSFWLYICNTDTTKNWSGGAYDTPVNLNSSNNNFRRIGNAYVWTYTLSSTQKYISVRTNTYSDGTNNITVKFWNLKIEKGNVYTPWSDTNSTTIADSSGYGHNGNIYGTTQLISDSPRYSTAIELTSTSSHINASGLVTSGFGSSYSFVWWAKSNSTTNMHWGFSDGIRLNGLYNGNLWNTGDSSNNPLYKPGTTTGISVTEANVWHHWAMTGDGTTCKVYKDGVHVANAKTWKAISGTSLWFNGWQNGASYAASSLALSDFRLYATALSAADIKQLYELGAKVDNLNNLHTFEINENSTNLKLLKTGVFKSPNFLESIVLVSGAGWSYNSSGGSNSCAGNITVDFSNFVDLHQPLTLTLEGDISWSNITPNGNGTFNARFQGNNQQIDGTWVWAGSNYAHPGTNQTSAMTTNATGSQHFKLEKTIPASWFNTYKASHVSYRTDYATGTITLSNFKVTISSVNLKIKSNAIYANNLIER